jgi:Uma2 family endonuclease
MVAPARQRAGYEEVLRAPADTIAQVVDGELHLSPRPGFAHQNVASVLGEELGPPFRRGRGGPGGWILLDDPELHLDAHILVPDLAGWRRERLPIIEDVAFLTLAPDWVCEILSPATARLDRVRKLPIYAQTKVSHAWIIDPGARTLEVFRLEGERWSLLATHGDEQRVRAEPFDAIELDLSLLWADVASNAAK